MTGKGLARMVNGGAFSTEARNGPRLKPGSDLEQIY